MFTYKDITFCNTFENGCKNRECHRHLKTKIKSYSQENNKDGLPISLADMSFNCMEYVKNVSVYDDE